MQDLQIEMSKLRETLNLAITELKKRGMDKAEKEMDYRIGLQQEILKHRANGIAVTIISDLCRGDKRIAKLKMERDIADTLYETAREKIHSTKLEIKIIMGDMEATRKGV